MIIENNHIGQNVPIDVNREEERHVVLIVIPQGLVPMLSLMSPENRRELLLVLAVLPSIMFENSGEQNPDEDELPGQRMPGPRQ